MRFVLRQKAHVDPPDIEPAFGVVEIHRSLRDLREPAKLSHSTLARSALVARHLRMKPGLPIADAVSAALSDGLVLLEGEAPALANLLRGRFWEGQAVQEMLRAERPERQSERRFFVSQSAANWVAASGGATWGRARCGGWSTSLVCAYDAF